MIPRIYENIETTPFGHQVRLLDGTTLSTVFKAQEPLAAVRVYVQMNGVNGEDFNLITPYPRRVYTDLDMEKPLRELGKSTYIRLINDVDHRGIRLSQHQSFMELSLYSTGLVPSAVLVVTKK